MILRYTLQYNKTYTFDNKQRYAQEKIIFLELQKNLILVLFSIKKLPASLEPFFVTYFS